MTFLNVKLGCVTALQNSHQIEPMTFLNVKLGRTKRSERVTLVTGKLVTQNSWGGMVEANLLLVFSFLLGGAITHKKG